MYSAEPKLFSLIRFRVCKFCFYNHNLSVFTSRSSEVAFIASTFSVTPSFMTVSFITKINCSYLPLEIYFYFILLIDVSSSVSHTQVLSTNSNVHNFLY